VIRNSSKGRKTSPAVAAPYLHPSSQVGVKKELSKKFNKREQSTSKAHSRVYYNEQLIKCAHAGAHYFLAVIFFLHPFYAISNKNRKI